MKRLIALLASFSALAVVSCINKEYDTNNVAVTVDVNQEPVELASNEILDIKSNSTVVTSNEEGDLSLMVKSDKCATVVAALDPMEPTPIPGRLEMNAGEELPEFCTAEAGAVFAESRVIIKLNNPSPDPVTYNGKLVSAGHEVMLPGIDVPASAIDYTVALVTKETPGLPVDETIVVDTDLADAISSISKDSGIVIKDLTVQPVGTRAARPASAEEFEFSVSAEFQSPMIFLPGTVIKLNLDFSGRLLDVSEYNITVNKYQVIADVTNTIPFNISASATSTNGVSATLKEPVKAGDVNNPTKVQAVFDVVSSSDVLNLEGVVVHLVFSTDKLVKINKSQTIDIDVKSLRFSKQ